MKTLVECIDCLSWLNQPGIERQNFALTFLDPPFNQGKEYRSHDDSMDSRDYWSFMQEVCKVVYEHTQEGGAIYFMQREKNTAQVLNVLRDTGWSFQNLIIWKKLTSAVPGVHRFGKSYQIIAFATKGRKPLVFNRLRISPRLPAGYKPHANGVFITDIWQDIRELTSGYFAGPEVLRDQNGERKHKQQSPIALLLRILLSSTMPGMKVLDPFAGSGVTAVVANQLQRESVSLELDPLNCALIRERLSDKRPSDQLEGLRSGYLHSENLDAIWVPYRTTEAEYSALSLRNALR